MKSIRYLFLYLLYLSLVTSCNVLEQDPVSNITLDRAFQKEGDVRAALMGVYNRLALESPGAAAEMPRRYLYNGEYRADSYMSITSAYPQAQQGNFNNVWPWANWQTYYAAIHSVNNLLFYGSKITDDKFSSPKEKNRLFGEAYFLRAFAYFNLVRVWENVVLRTEPILDADGDFLGAQVAPAEVLAQIEADLLQAAQLLPVDYPQSNRGRATRGAAHALLAKYYVYISSPYAQQRLNVGPTQWAKAASYADSVISNRSLYSLVPGPSYETIFTQNGTTESIFELVYDATITGPNAENDLDLFLPRKNTPPTGGGYGLMPSDKLIDAFKSMNDTVRFNAAMAEVRAADGWDTRDVGKTVPYLRDRSAPGGTRQKYNNHYVKKYPGTIIANIRYSDSNIIFLRLADVILLKAEALFELGRTDDAQTALNLVTQRADIGIRPVSVDEIMLQRWLELAFEGDRWYDLKRRMLLEEETGPYAAYPKGYFFPIVNGEVINNPNVKQNPGW